MQRQGRQFSRPHTKSQGAEAAGIDALEAVDASGAVGVLIGFATGGALPLTGQAMDAFFFIELKTKEADPIKQAIESSQGAKNAAEKPADEDGADNDNNQPDKLVYEIDAEVLPQGGFENQERHSAREGPGRTKEFAKPGLAQTEFID